MFGRAQLAVDTTLVAAHHCDGTARPGTATKDGAAMAVDFRRKEVTCPPQRAKLVVMAREVGGRWLSETVTFLTLLVATNARSEKALLRRLV